MKNLRNFLISLVILFIALSVITGNEWVITAAVISIVLLGIYISLVHLIAWLYTKYYKPWLDKYKTNTEEEDDDIIPIEIFIYSCIVCGRKHTNPKHLDRFGCIICSDPDLQD